MRKLQFYIPPLGDAYGFIANSHFKPIEKYLPKDSYEIKEATAKAIHEANYHNDKKYIRVSFTLGDFFPAVFITHGMADKGLQSVKDLNRQIAGCYPGPTYINKLTSEGVKPSHLRVIGYPRLDPVFRARKGLRLKKGKTKVLWAPTHNTCKPWSSFGRFDINNILGSDFDVVESVHPHNRRPPKKTSLEHLVDADIVISDTSSMLYEALSLGIPVILLKWIVKRPVGIEKHIYTRPKGEEICWMAESYPDLVTKIKMVKENGFKQGPGAESFLHGIFPEELRGKSGKKAAKVLLDFIQ